MIHKRPGYDPFFAENPFSPADELVFMGLVARSCHFDVTACAEARRLAQRAERPLRGLSALWASRRASRAGWKIGKKHDFVQILGLKTPISVDRNFEHLTSEGSVTRNFEVSSFLTPSLQNMDIDGPN